MSDQFNTDYPSSRLEVSRHGLEQFHGLEGSFDIDWFEERFKPLLTKSDVELFTQGGCHIFAEALHERFEYPIHIVFGDGQGSVSHAFCLVDPGVKHAVDVVGFTNLDQRVGGDFRRNIYSPPLSLAEFRKYYRVDQGPGLFGHRVFWEPALIRAHARIKTFLQYYDGTQVAQTPDAPRKNMG